MRAREGRAAPTRMTAPTRDDGQTAVVPVRGASHPGRPVAGHMRARRLRRRAGTPSSVRPDEPDHGEARMRAAMREERYPGWGR